MTAPGRHRRIWIIEQLVKSERGKPYWGEWGPTMYWSNDYRNACEGLRELRAEKENAPLAFRITKYVPEKQ